MTPRMYFRKNNSLFLSSLYNFLMLYFSRVRQLSRLFTVAATIIGCNRSIFASSKLGEKASRVYISSNPFFVSKFAQCQSMATSTSGGKDEHDSVLVGALRKAGINKSPKDVTDEEWARILSPTKYGILRQADTEPAFSGGYLNTKEEGVYHCGACGAILFDSKTKFESHCGWPAFYASVPAGAEKLSEIDDDSNVGRRPDNSFGRIRTEIYCKKCNSHLGHVFDDGPKPTGERHCVNSEAIEFVPSAVTKK